MAEIDRSFNFECHTISTPEECKPIITKYALKLLQVNIRSMDKNFDDFLLIFARLNISFDIIIFSECWINENSTIKQIDGYISYNTKKYINKSGGVIVYVNNKWSPNVHEPDMADANCLVVDIPSVATVLGCYRSRHLRTLLISSCLSTSSSALLAKNLVL